VLGVEHRRSFQVDRRFRASGLDFRGRRLVNRSKLEELGRDRVVEQLAARLAAQKLWIPMPRHVHDLRGRRAGHIGRRHEPPGAGCGLRYCRSRPGPRRRRDFTTSATSRPLIRYVVDHFSNLVF
jgi:hypothetical protein